MYCKRGGDAQGAITTAAEIGVCKGCSGVAAIPVYTVPEIKMLKPQSQQQAPAEHMCSRGEGYVRDSIFNVRACGTDELLTICSITPYEDVRFMSLGHYHTTMILRSWLIKSHWHLAANAENEILY